MIVFFFRFQFFTSLAAPTHKRKHSLSIRCQSQFASIYFNTYQYISSAFLFLFRFLLQFLHNFCTRIRKLFIHCNFQIDFGWCQWVLSDGYSTNAIALLLLVIDALLGLQEMRSTTYSIFISILHRNFLDIYLFAVLSRFLFSSIPFDSITRSLLLVVQQTKRIQNENRFY